ncbi:4196d626-36d8-43bd-9a53-2dcfe937b147 [Thermothielavioides terrestris]|uniref:4196d626-36d8-43bd-9a53-2dcfe937b147 n=1 Tax=Thermothielavioides terrestris TaxID=2587410 RepID=A0A3S4EVP3_9PEZI|nr:4196d626-36d8-43bd-9a53-2dcfe937b147 [Thermothielavioides terrestris]
MGKTEIAVEYAHSHRADFDAVLWVNGASEEKLNAGFRDIAVKLGLQDETDPRDDPIATREIVKAWLSKPVRVQYPGPQEQEPDVKWLLVFDNADDPDLLTDFWPHDRVGSILVTSRNPLKLSLKEFLERYDKDAKSFQELPVPGLTKDQTIASTWNIESLPSPARALLRVLSVLDPDAIPEDILTTGVSGVDLEHYPKTEKEYIDAREELLKSSLVSWNRDLGFLKIHRLVQDVVREKMSLDELRAAYNAAVTLVSAVWPFLDDSNLNKVDRMRKVQRCLPQVAALKAVLQEKTPSVLQPDIKISALLNETSWYYILQPSGYGLHDGEEFAVLSERVLDSFAGEKDEEHWTKLLADSYRYQGITGTYKNSQAAVTNCKKWLSVLVDRIEKYGDQADVKTLPIAYNEIGMALMRVPDLEEAKKSWIMSCETLEKVTDPGELVFPFPWVHRALVAAYYSEDLDSAESLIAPILKKREEKLGVDDTTTIETGLILAFMGNIRRLQGKADEAYEFRKRAVSVLKVTCGENSVQASMAYYRLAVDEFERGGFEKSCSLLAKCASFYGEIPWYKPEAARSAWKHGRALQAMGGSENQVEARKLLDEAMRLRHELVPDDGRPEPELVDDDWDRLVYYFFR